MVRRSRQTSSAATNDDSAAAAVDMSVTVGSLQLPAPILTASGTAGHGLELSPFGDLSLLGAHVVKSLAAFEWAGNPAPRVHPVAFGMLNAVGLQGPGVAAWVRDDLPRLRAAGVRVVASIWGRTVDDYVAAARLLRYVDGITALEVNLSCPNLEGRRGIFAHDAELSGTVIEAVAGVTERSFPLWAKLSPNTDRIVEVAGAVHRAGADSVTLVNTLLGLAIDVESGQAVLGAGGGGFSGPAMHPVAVRAVHDVRSAHPDLAIVGVGGAHDAITAIELLMAGANAVQVGTATFADPRSPWQVLDGVRAWCATRCVSAVASLTGAVHRTPPKRLV